MGSEITEGYFLENTRELSSEERRAAMTAQEQDLEDVKAASASEAAAGPMRLAGLATVKIQVLPDFDDAMKVVMESENKACLGVLSGPKGEAISGRVLDDIEDATNLRGKLPEGEACYVVLNVKAITRAETVTSGSITCEDDLDPKLGRHKSVVLQEEPDQEVHTRPKGGPPAGAVRMPGMGAPMAGGFKLPGMGSK